MESGDQETEFQNVNYIDIRHYSEQNLQNKFYAKKGVQYFTTLWDPHHEAEPPCAPQNAPHRLKVSFD